MWQVVGMHEEEAGVANLFDDDQFTQLVVWVTQSEVGFSQVDLTPNSLIFPSYIQHAPSRLAARPDILFTPVHCPVSLCIGV